MNRLEMQAGRWTVAFTTNNGQTRTSTGGDQHYAAGGRGAGAAGDLHDHRAGAAVGNRSGCAQDAHGQRDYRAADGGDHRPRPERIFLAISRSIFTIWPRSCARRALIRRTQDGESGNLPQADERVPFGAFASVMDAVKQAGITNISIVTQPLETKGVGAMGF